MLRFILGGWVVAGVVIAGLLTAVAQNPLPLAEPRPQATPQATAGRDLEIQFRTTSGGVLEIASLDRRGAAYESGLREGDQIVSVGGRTIQMEQALRQFLRETPLDPVPVVVTRNGQQERILLASRERAPRDEPPLGAHSRATIGVRLTDSPAGVRIAEVAPGGPAAQAGLRVGDFIVRLEGQRYADAAELAAAVARAPVARPLALDVTRDGVTVRRQVRPESYAAIYGRRTITERHSPPPAGQRLAARADFDLAGRVEQLEGQIAALREEMQALRERVDALLADQPADANATEFAAPNRRAVPAPAGEEVPEPPGRAAAPPDSRRPAEPDDVLPSPPEAPQE